MRYRITLSETAVRQLRKLPREDRTQVARGLRVLEDDPFRPRAKADIRALEGTEPRKYRLRVGDYQAVYAVEKGEVRMIEVFVRSGRYR